MGMCDESNAMHRVLAEVMNQVGNRMQEMEYQYEHHPPLVRSEVLEKAGGMLHEMEPLVGKRDGSQVFCRSLIRTAAYLLFAAASCYMNQLGVD